jgi:hypothetical protein
MRIACCTIKGTNTHSEYEILIAFCTATMFTRTLLNVCTLPVLLINALFSVSWNVMVLTEVGVTMTSGSIQLSAVHMYNLLFSCFVNSSFVSIYERFIGICLFTTPCPAVSPVIRWFQLLVLCFAPPNGLF